MLKKILTSLLCIMMISSFSPTYADEEITQYAYLPCNDTTRETGIALDVDTSVFTNGWSGAVGGKADNERIYMLYAKNGGNATGNKRDWIRYNAANGCDMEYVTAEFEVYMETTDIPLNVQFWPMNAGGLKLIEFKTNGMVDVNGDELAPYEPLRWYNVAFTFCKSTKLLDVYFNGVHIKTDSTYAKNSADIIFDDVRIVPSYTFDGTKITESQLEKKFYFDNIRVYGSNLPVSLPCVELESQNDEVTVYEDENLICADDISSVSCGEIIAMVGADDKTIRIYSDSATSKLLSDDELITDESVMVVSNERIFEYYTFADYFEMTNFEFTTNPENETEIGVNAGFVSRKNPQNVTAVMVIRGDDGAALKVVSSKTYEVSGHCDIEISPVQTDGGRVYAYFIDDWANICAYYAEAIECNQLERDDIN